MDTKFEGCPNAIALCEKLTNWKMYAATAEAEGLYMLRERMRQSATEAMERGDPERKEVIRKALEEWDHPDFSLWLKAKITGYFGELT